MGWSGLLLQPTHWLDQHECLICEFAGGHDGHALPRSSEMDFHHVTVRAFRVAYVSDAPVSDASAVDLELIELRVGGEGAQGFALIVEPHAERDAVGSRKAVVGGQSSRAVDKIDRPVHRSSIPDSVCILYNRIVIKTMAEHSSFRLVAGFSRGGAEAIWRKGVATLALLTLEC